MDITIVLATLSDYFAIQNMARFYVYDLSRECGFISSEWALPLDGLYESFDFKDYFQDSDKKAFLINVDKEIAGFVLLNQHGILPETKWNMEEFFILAKFQGKGIGSKAAQHIWNAHPGMWEVSVIPENKNAANFWRRVILSYS
jgi:predicted acetyltransferase